MKRFLFLIATLSICAIAHTQNDVKGQAQLKGIAGAFGTVYSLQNGFNLAILEARYTVDPLNAYLGINARVDQKILVIEFSLKNARPEDNFFDSTSMFSVVDTAGQVYQEFGIALESKGATEGSFTLRPGQGIGQPDLKDPLRVAFPVPANVKIDKIMLNQGRLNTDEKVIRFPIIIANAKKDDKNVIAPLPDNVRAADPSGAVALPSGKLEKGVFVSSGPFALRLDEMVTTSDLLEAAPPGDGHVFIVLKMTGKLLAGQDDNMYTITGGDDPEHAIEDSDGETYRPTHFYKASKDEAAEKEFKTGDEYHFRMVFEVPQAAKLKTLTIGAGNFRKWTMALGG